MSNAERSSYFARREAVKVLQSVLQRDAHRRAVGSIKSSDPHIFKGFKGTKTFSFIDEAIICHGSLGKNRAIIEGTENSVYLEVLRLFAHGTWSDYKSNSGSLPQLHPGQVLKLKQLTVLTLAEANKVLPYDQLMLELDVTNVRELEDFIINECIYAGIVRGKLDQMRRCFEVQFAAGRDLRPGQLGSMIQTLSNWLSTSDNLLISIQEKIKWADTMSELDKKHRKDVEDRVEEVKKSISVEVG
ncbi:hypothetical protein HRI_004149100 [Hibiscus trionum]|uniref:PCI domain-containing protein n=1 Tax=Hibiscus trionum TaxID=183268 RepID=A0A9W7J3Q5_HIBTR|nr:hypothetical protein HRI_004149100 [Hibiscus trionum]